MTGARRLTMAILLGLMTLAGCGTGSPTAVPAATSAGAAVSSPAPSPAAPESTAERSATATAATTPAHPASSDTGVPGCADADLSIALGPGLSPQTGEQGVVIALHNRGAAACGVRGYLSVHFRVSGSSAEQAMTQAGGSYVTSAAPSLVTLAPGQDAYAIVAAYRCDLGAQTYVDSLSVSAPGSSAATTLTLGHQGVASFPYCPGQQGHGPAFFQMSPVEPTVAAAAGA